MASLASLTVRHTGEVSLTVPDKTSDEEVEAEDLRSLIGGHAASLAAEGSGGSSLQAFAALGGARPVRLALSIGPGQFSLGL